MSKKTVSNSWKQDAKDGICTTWEIHDKIKHNVCFLLGDSPASEFYMPYKIQTQGITQKKAYNIQDKAEVWNQEIKQKFHKNVKLLHYLYFRPDGIRVNNLRNFIFCGWYFVLGI